MHRWVWTVVIAVLVLFTFSLAWASGLVLGGLGNPLYGANVTSGCDVGSVYPFPRRLAGTPNTWAFWRIETSNYDASCEGMELRARVAWDGTDDGQEPDGYYYMRVPVTADLTQPTIVAGIFGDAVPLFCDPNNCFQKDPEGHDIVYYVYSDASYSEESIIDDMPDVAGHTLLWTDWVVVDEDEPPGEF